jgi:16S rRNA (guanine1207-N2)-methyltransferase
MEPVTTLLLEEASYGDAPGSWLVLGGEAALPAALAGEGRMVHWKPLMIAERETAPSDVVARDDIEDGAYGRVVLPVPFDRDLARRWILLARDALATGGDLLVAGANSAGAKSVIADAKAVFGEPVAAGYRQKHRFARFVRRDERRDLPAWATKEGIVPGKWQRFIVEARGENLVLETQPGVFAGNRLDAGTALLLEHLDIPVGGRVLDVGCGAGVIGIMAHRLGAAHVDLVDANLLAVGAASRNIERLGVHGRALASDTYDAVGDERYDLIASNPPFHRGKEVDTSVADRLIDEAPAHLLPGGSLVIVANAFLAYGKRMARVFTLVETVAATRQYHVLRATDPVLS